jgi:tRNA dimethylallyltransferase
MLEKKIQDFLQNAKSPVIEILGPTASGKTKFTIDLAKWLKNAEVIVVDSRQVYRGCDISSAKISQKSMEGVTHHGMDLCEPDEKITVFDFKSFAEAKIRAILNRGNIPILSGGTMLWLDAISENYIFDKNPGKKSLKKGKKIFDFLKLGIIWDREVLYQRIDARAQWQFENGLIEETRNFFMNPDRHAKTCQSFWTSFGYLEILEYLQGTLSYEEALAKNQQRNRNYAKRQLTWWREREDIIWLPGEKLESLIPSIDSVPV